MPFAWFVLEASKVLMALSASEDPTKNLFMYVCDTMDNRAHVLPLFVAPASD